MELNDKNESQILKEIAAGKYRDCYLVYIRKSTDEPDNQKNSIVYQKAENIKFAQHEKPIRELFAGLYEQIAGEVSARGKILSYRRSETPDPKKQQALSELALRYSQATA